MIDQILLQNLFRGQRPIIGVDFNCTIQDKIQGIIEHAKIIHGATLTRQDFGVWDAPLGAKLGMTDQQAVRWCWQNDRIELEAPPYPGAAQALARLSKIATIKIVTSSHAPALVVQWLKMHAIPYDDLHFTRDKLSADFDLIIDDSPVVIDQMLAAQRPVIAFRQPWNRCKQNVPAIESWI